MNGQVKIDRGGMVWELLARPSMEQKFVGQDDVVHVSWNRHR